MSELERWMTDELGRGLGGLYPEPNSFEALKAHQAGRWGRVTVKAAALAAAAVILSGGVVFAAGTALSGTPNPAAWGQQVSDHVATCKQQLATGQHGIGDCVSAFARQHGEQQRAQQGHATTSTPAATHGVGHKVGPGPASPAAKPTKAPLPKTPQR